jgi:hypothetical protein
MQFTAFDGVFGNLDPPILPLLSDHLQSFWRWSVVAETAPTAVLALASAE